jgi:hypothetical protein
MHLRNLFSPAEAAAVFSCQLFEFPEYILACSIERVHV